MDWGLRDYGEQTNTIWGGDPNCEHEWEIKYMRKRTPGDKPSENSIVAKHRPDEVNRPEIKSQFCKKCGAWYGQLGLEPTLEMYLEHMLQITAELKRVLKPGGVCFWNHGDSYATQSGSGKIYENIMPGYEEKAGSDGLRHRKLLERQGIPRKSLFLQNFRLILRMIDEQNWILRNVIIWNKPNHMPSSVKDRFSNSYEPVFMLVKNKKYYFDLDDVRVPHKTPLDVLNNRIKYDLERKGGKLQEAGVQTGVWSTHQREINPLGKNPGDLWTIPTQPFPEAHFATYPEKLIEPMIKSGCPQWICKKCGKARVRIVETEYDWQTNGKTKGKKQSSGKMATIPGHAISKKYTIGFTDCGCQAGWRPGIVLDPFAGSGTTSLVAEKLGRDSIGIELNPDYVKLIKKRLKPFLNQMNLKGDKTTLKIIDLR